MVFSFSKSQNQIQLKKANPVMLLENMRNLNSQLKGHILIMCPQKHISAVRNNWAFNILELLK